MHQIPTSITFNPFTETLYLNLSRVVCPKITTIGTVTGSFNLNGGITYAPAHTCFQRPGITSELNYYSRKENYSMRLHFGPVHFSYHVMSFVILVQGSYTLLISASGYMHDEDSFLYAILKRYLIKMPHRHSFLFT